MLMRTVSKHSVRRRDPRSSGSPRSEVDRLIKQTFSVHVSLPDDRPRGVTRKWHLSKYHLPSTMMSGTDPDFSPICIVCVVVA